MMSQRTSRIAVLIFGAIVSVSGALEILLALTGNTLELNRIISFSGGFMLWRGFILGSAGLYYLFTVRIKNPVEARAQVVLGSVMIWIVAGMEILEIVLGSIPGEGNRWLSSWSNFSGSYGGPYDPVLFLLPASIVIVWLIHTRIMFYKEE